MTKKFLSLMATLFCCAQAQEQVAQQANSNSSSVFEQTDEYKQMSFFEKIEMAIDKFNDDVQNNRTQLQSSNPLIDTPKLSQVTFPISDALSVSKSHQSPIVAAPKGDGHKNDDCFTLLQQIFNKFMTNRKQVEQIYRYSGKDYNDFGRYEDCKDLPNFNYLLAEIHQENLTHPLAMGICLPDRCKEVDLNSFKSYLLPALNAEFPVIFENVSTLANIELSNDDLVFVDTERENKEASEFDFIAAFFLFITFSMIITVIISTFLSLQWMRERKRTALEKIQSNPNAFSNQQSNDDNQEGLLVSYSDDDTASQSSETKKKLLVRTQDLTTGEKFVRCFSLQRNFYKLLKGNKFDPSDKELEIFNCCKFISICLIVVGNTYFYTLSGPLRNFDVIYNWFITPGFLIIMHADFQADVFFWMTGFITAYTLLKKMHQNGGNMPRHPIVMTLTRYARFLPLYTYLILFLWKFIDMLGGDGPRFYQFEKGHGCKKTYLWHFLMVNNLIPWGERDYCIEPSWYLANDIQVMLLSLPLISMYASNRNTYTIWLAILVVGAVAIQFIQISGEGYSVSFFAQYGDYWTKFYNKPWVRIVPNLLGVNCGCVFYSYKHEDITKQWQIFKNMFDAIKTQNIMTLLSSGVGFFLMFMITCLCKMVSVATSPAPTTMLVEIYLIISRPVYVIGFSLFILPLLLQNKLVRPLQNFMSHAWFAPYARLTFGVFLCNTIFMQFNTFNLANGIFAQRWQVSMEWCAYLTFSFVFSLWTYLFIEAPFANLLTDFLLAKENPQEQFYQSMSAKAIQRRKTGKKSSQQSVDEEQSRQKKQRQLKKDRKPTNINQDDYDEEDNEQSVIHKNKKKVAIQQEYDDEYEE